MLRAHGAGRFVADPIVEEVNGTKVCRFTLAFEEYRKSSEGEQKKNVSFVDVQSWGTSVDIIEKFCKKGDLFIVDDATIRQDKWIGPDGGQRSKLYLRLNSFTLAGKKDV